MKQLLFLCTLIYACLGGGFAFRLNAGEPSTFQLRPAAQVDGEGIFLNQLLESNTPGTPLRLADAPTFGKTLCLTRAQVGDLAREAGLESASTNWTGSELVRVSRRSRTFSETEALQLLTLTLQQDYVKDKGELELRCSRPWAPVPVPNEPLSLRIVDLPASGVGAAFIARFELRTSKGERLGPWQVPVQAHVWREVWIARTALKRNESLREAELARERRDVLAWHDPLAEFAPDDPSLEMAEPIQAGSPLLARSVRPRPVIRRGQSLAALLQDGALAITLKVEALEDGVPGQLIRIRNPITRRDLRGKVIDDQNVLVTL